LSSPELERRIDAKFGRVFARNDLDCRIRCLARLNHVVPPFLPIMFQQLDGKMLSNPSAPALNFPQPLVPRQPWRPYLSEGAGIPATP
jgi:hypothetical protein